jgi:hypothetical protein
MFGATLASPTSAAVDIYVNEWMRQSANIVDPADGDRRLVRTLQCWNHTRIYGYYLTMIDLSHELQIPANGQYTIPPGGFLLVCADEEGSQNHPPARICMPAPLERGGESIALPAGWTTPIDSSVCEQPTRGQDVS